MNLLILSENGEVMEEGFGPHFDRVTHRKLSETRINLLENEEDVLAGKDSINQYDSLFVIPEPELAVYVRTMLERVETGFTLNLDSTSSYILLKKQYLYKVLTEKGVPIPRTSVIGCGKSASAIKNFDYPLVVRRYEGLERRDIDLVVNKEEMQSFCDSVEYGEEIVILQELVEDEVFDCLVMGDEVISLKLSDSGEWRLEAGECNEKYYKAPSTVKDLAVSARKSIGANICRVKVVGDKAVNISPDPQLERFKEASSKDTYKKAAEVLKG